MTIIYCEGQPCRYCGKKTYGTFRSVCVARNSFAPLELSTINAKANATAKSTTDAVRSCVHLGSPTTEIALIQCTTCQGNVRKKFPVHECAVFGKCLPKYSGENEAGHGCVGCARREPAIYSASV